MTRKSRRSVSGVKKLADTGSEENLQQPHPMAEIIQPNALATPKSKEEKTAATPGSKRTAEGVTPRQQELAITASATPLKSGDAVSDKTAVRRRGRPSLGNRGIGQATVAAATTVKERGVAR